MVFAHLGGIRQPHPFESASDALEESLPTKNEQLNVQGRERSLGPRSTLFGKIEVLRVGQFELCTHTLPIAQIIGRCSSRLMRNPVIAPGRRPLLSSTKRRALPVRLPT